MPKYVNFIFCGKGTEVKTKNDVLLGEIYYNHVSKSYIFSPIDGASLGSLGLLEIVNFLKAENEGTKIYQ